MITDRQVRLLRQKRMEGKTQETAAAKAGMSVRSACKWQSGPLPSATKPEHRWRTRPDPFDGVWEDEIEPLLRGDPTGKLKATTIIECPSTSSGGGAASRSLQRRPAAHAATTIAGLACAARALPQQNRYPTQMVASNKMLPKIGEAIAWEEASARWQNRNCWRRSETATELHRSGRKAGFWTSSSRN